MNFCHTMCHIHPFTSAYFSSHICTLSETIFFSLFPHLHLSCLFSSLSPSLLSFSLFCPHLPPPFSGHCVLQYCYFHFTPFPLGTRFFSRVDLFQQSLSWWSLLCPIFTFVPLYGIFSPWTSHPGPHFYCLFGIVGLAFKKIISFSTCHPFNLHMFI